MCRSLAVRGGPEFACIVLVLLSSTLLSISSASRGLGDTWVGSVLRLARPCACPEHFPNHPRLVVLPHSDSCFVEGVGPMWGIAGLACNYPPALLFVFCATVDLCS